MSRMETPYGKAKEFFHPKSGQQKLDKSKMGPKKYVTDLYHPYLAGLGCLFVVSWLKGATPHPSPIPVARPVRIVDLPCSTYGK